MTEEQRSQTGCIAGRMPAPIYDEIRVSYGAGGPPAKSGQTFKKGNMAAVVYVSEVRLERVRGPLRLARLPVESTPVAFGTHGPIARHYGIHGEIPDPHATTIDYLVAAAAG